MSDSVCYILGILHITFTSIINRLHLLLMKNVLDLVLHTLVRNFHIETVLRNNLRRRLFLFMSMVNLITCTTTSIVEVVMFSRRRFPSRSFRNNVLVTYSCLLLPVFVDVTYSATTC